MDEKKALCERCRNFFPYSEIRYMPKGKDSMIALCSSCRTKAAAESKESKKEDSGKMPFFCARCKYKFKYDPKSITNFKCPYCGKNDKIIKDKRPSAAKLLAENFE